MTTSAVAPWPFPHGSLDITTTSLLLTPLPSESHRPSGDHAKLKIFPTLYRVKKSFASRYRKHFGGFETAEATRITKQVAVELTMKKPN